jgi:glycosyltransferase involved in cell wall biosynthesis
MSPRRKRLAVVGGFVKARPEDAQGTYHAAYATCDALARSGRFDGIDVFRSRSVRGRMQLPQTPPTRVFDRTALANTSEAYAAIYVANGEQLTAAPHVLRPAYDCAPVVCSVGTAHVNGQWTNLLVAHATGAIRATDGFIFKSGAAERLFRETWADWSSRFKFMPSSLPLATVIPNGVDVAVNRRSDSLRHEMRAQLRVRNDDVLFLCFSRLSPATKGDQLALVARWKEVSSRHPRSILALTGAVVDHAFVAELRHTARAAGGAVMILDNPFDVYPDARRRLMSAADAFLHLSTGIEETSPLVVHEAMAHGLPVIATAWAGLPEIISAGENGFLIETHYANLSSTLAATVFGDLSLTHASLASGLVTLDWAALVAAVGRLNDGATRLRMGHEARRRAEAGAIETVARAHVDFFDRAAAEAARAWQGPTTFVPLVDLNRVLAAQATAEIDPARKIRLHPRGLDETGSTFLPLGLSSDAQGRLRVMHAALVAAGELSAHAVIGALAPSPSSSSSVTDGASETAGHLLVRLLNHGVVVFVDGPDDRPA